MKAYVELALERWAEDYNEQWEKRNNWEEWLQSHQYIPSVKTLISQRKTPYKNWTNPKEGESNGTIE